MRIFLKRFAVGAVGLAVAGLLLTVAYVTPIMTTEIDANLMKPQCPGGKEWDRPGSSCRDGIIFDFYLPPVVAPKSSEIGQKKIVTLKKKKGH